MNINDKINYLSNNYVVTEQELMDALLLNKPDVLDTDLYLSIQAVMISVTRETPKVILNFINTLINRVDISVGFENKMYRIFHTLNSLSEEVGVEYLSEIFGKYMLAKGIILLNYINKIEEAKYKIQ